MSFLLTTLKFFAVDVVWSFLYFPIWWYTKGTKQAAAFVLRKMAGVEHALGLGILLKYLFQPMYADYTKSGRMISFVFRLLQLGVSMIIMAVSFVFFLLLMILWLGWLPVAIYFIVANLSGL